MIFINLENSCSCEYCEHYGQIVDAGYYFPNHKGICIKHGIIRYHYDYICDDFVLKSGIHTKKYYPTTKNGLED